MSIEDPDCFFDYSSLLQEAIGRLSGNIHFLRSLFNLIDENTSSDNPIHNIPPHVFPDLLQALNETGITSDFEEDEAAARNDEPRDHQFHIHRFTDIDTGEESNVRMKIPSDYLPIHWNIPRLVNPSLNPSFQELSGILERDANTNMDGKINEGEQYIHELEHGRRYGLSFSRVKVTEIPDTEDMDIWFHYSHDEEMEPHEIRVEVVVNDAGIIYYLNNDRIEMRSHGNVVPRIPIEDIEPDHLDVLYGQNDVRNWASADAQRNLFFYVAKYAHALLVLPRTTGNRSQSTSPDNGDNPFDFRLGEHSTQTYMPGNNTGGAGTSGYTITAYHGVAPHIRNLPPGHRASPEAVAEAEKHHIFLAPGQTFVRPHARGSEMTEQGKDGRGINNR